ncbi:MAG TPA: hypothetical protein VKV36_04420 [Acidimicrobiales bacterium]|nr:hypothetical protein [Acidimicrobiales bacterium]
MLAAVGLDVDARSFDLSFRRPPLSERSGQPVLVGMGDPVVGPLVGLFFDAPSTPEQLAGPPDLTPAHSHPCDNFRVVMKGELWVGRERYHHGEFRLQRSGRPYGSDGDAPHPEGNWRVIFFADRRGHRVRPTNPELRARAASPEAMAATRARFGELLPVILPDDDDGVDGLVTTIAKPFSKLGHIDGSFDEAAGWEPVGASVRLAASLMGAHDAGPVVLLQRTEPGAVATPACTFGSDVFRCVVSGSCRRGREDAVMGDTRFQAADVPWDEVVAGPEGLDEVIIVGDRRGATPRPTAADGAGWAARVTELVAELHDRLGGLVPA